MIKIIRHLKSKGKMRLTKRGLLLTKISTSRVKFATNNIYFQYKLFFLSYIIYDSPGILFSQGWCVIKKFLMFIIDICRDVTWGFILPQSHLISHQRVWNSNKAIFAASRCLSRLSSICFLIWLSPDLKR